MTRLRIDVLRELWSAAGCAIGAYDLTARLVQRDGRRLAPNSVYRSISSLRTLGLVQRIESRNAYIIADEREGDGIYLLCDTCDRVGIIRAPRIDQLIEQASRDIGFISAHHAIEVTGHCAVCVITADAL